MTVIHFAMFIVGVILVFVATDLFLRGVLIFLDEIGMSLGVINTEGNAGNIGWLDGLVNILASIVLMIMIRGMMILSRLFSLDMYSLKNKKIDANIKEKVKMYDKHHKKWYL